VNPLQNVNIARWYMEWWNGRQMDNYVGDALDKRYADFTSSEPSSKRGKSVIDLVFQAYQPNNKSPPPGSKLPPTLRSFAISQIRLFMFAGHDSTSSTVCYCLYLLSKNPEALAAIRREHNRILDPDISTTASLLESNPNIINSLPYTTAVIKETLRLFPPASTSRRGKPEDKTTSVTSDLGTSLPTADTVVFMLHQATHRSPKYWVQPDKFLPDRWIVEPGHELYPRKGAWRPFEMGPRNCIAQGLAMTTLKVILVSVVREFDFEAAYEKNGLKYGGELVYQMESGAAHPISGYPCRVSVRQMSGK